MRTEANARSAIALLTRAIESGELKFPPMVLVLLSGQVNALRFMLREESPGPDTLEELLVKYARYFEVEDAKAEAGVTP